MCGWLTYINNNTLDMSSHRWQGGRYPSMPGAMTNNKHYVTFITGITLYDTYSYDNRYPQQLDCG